jgi:hypothetical protein
MARAGMLYRLEGHTPVPEEDIFVWGNNWKKCRRISRTWVGDQLVSTVFLGIDHSFGDGPPVLFETMVFGGKMDGHQLRYTSWVKAARGHALTVSWVSQNTSFWRLAWGWTRRLLGGLED